MLEKNETITIRISTEDRQEMERRAYAYGMSVSQYVRFKAITEPKLNEQNQKGEQ